MRLFFSRWIIVAAVAVFAFSAGVFLFFSLRGKDVLRAVSVESIKKNQSGVNSEVIGFSLEGRKIQAYTYGNGENRLIFVGGVHGGYEWNSAVLAYKFVDYFGAYPDSIPENLSVAIIPSANPDGVYKAIGRNDRFTDADVPAGVSLVPSRFNSRGVDLNRNFDCKWKPESMWRGDLVSGGSAAFSEPESTAIRDYILKNKPSAVLFWHSQANAVYASECEAGILPKTIDIMNAYSRASGYPAVKSFDQYEITGDAEGWLASVGIPAITVELKTRETIEWEQNLKGVKALFEYYDNFISRSK